MWGRNIKWCVGIILAVALTGSVPAEGEMTP